MKGSAVRIRSSALPSNPRRGGGFLVLGAAREFDQPEARRSGVWAGDSEAAGASFHRKGMSGDALLAAVTEAVVVLHERYYRRPSGTAKTQ
jgi:hypothetical protein